MNRKMSKRQRDIKSKLMAAICMLLVSSIMMVSTTYAWFTLSTAPEVTGISTAVGANGNLEMALMPTTGDFDDITSTSEDGNKAWNLRNLTWGNLVDLSDDAVYGMDKMVLYPSALNVAADATATTLAQLADAMLKTPEYGADGRVTELSQKTVTSTYNGSSFPQNEELGVRAIGTASGMTDRQLDYRNARSAASTAMSQAKIFASQSLNSNGASLANIAMAHAADPNATYTSTDISHLKGIVNDLLGYDNGGSHVTGVLEYVEKAYIQYLFALAASNSSTEEGYAAVKALVNAGNSAENIVAAMGTVDLGNISTYLSDLAATKATVQAALSDLNAITAADGITWAQISVPLNKLAKTDAMIVNNIPVSEVKERMSELVSSVTGGAGLTVTIASGGGVYADVADHCGNYNASITIKQVSYGGITLDEMPAKMQTNTTVTTVNLDVVGTAVNAAGAPEGTGNQVMPITDFYGYIVDLAFRTNAAESNLLLQTEAADRIYSADKAGTETTGHGSTMSFTAGTPDFTTDQMVNLMECIRVVFINTNNEILATAKLDMTEGEYTVVGGNTVTANLYLYEELAETTTKTEYFRAKYIADTTAEGTYKAATGDEVATHALIGEEYVLATHVLDETSNTYVEAADGQTATHAVKTTTKEAGTHLLKGNDAKIMALPQNTPAAVSALVYLDGEDVTNADVAATGTASMTGTMNLQFSSTANLVPMEYTPLMKQEGTGGGVTVSNYDVSMAADTLPGVTLTDNAAKATANIAYSFKLAGTDGKTITGVTYTVGEDTTEQTASYDTATQKYTIPADKVTGAIVIKVSGSETQNP